MKRARSSGADNFSMRHGGTNLANNSWLIVIFGEQGMGLLPTTRGLGSKWTRWRLLRHLRPLYPAPAAWRLSQLAPRLTKNDTAGEVSNTPPQVWQTI